MAEPCQICEWQDGSHNSTCLISALQQRVAELEHVIEQGFWIVEGRDYDAWRDMARAALTPHQPAPVEDP